MTSQIVIFEGGLLLSMVPCGLEHIVLHRIQNICCCVSPSPHTVPVSHYCSAVSSLTLDPVYVLILENGKK